MEFKDLVGQTLISAITDGTHEIVLKTEHRTYMLHHNGSCCETVEIESIVGDLQDLVGSPLLICEASSNTKSVEYGDETWTFYKMATIGGYVDIRWFGESNGYYSTEVDFEEIV
jgi:hypothetical protein